MKIMAALDFSPYADFVLVKAIKTAIQQNAKLDIFMVARDWSEEGNACDWEAVKEQRMHQAMAAARAHQKKARDHGVKTKVRVRSGKSVADEIIKYQQEEGLDLIVIGRRSHKGRDPFSIGEVARRVAAHATSTVMVVRCKNPERDE